MARGVHPTSFNAADTSVASDTPPPFSPLSHTVATSTSPSHSPPPSEYRFPSTSDAEFLHMLNAERERRYKAESELVIARAELANTQAKLAAAEKALEELRGKHWTSHMMQAAEEMGPGGALIATVGAPVMAAPLAVATVVKGFQSVGTGIGFLFSGKGKGKDTPNNVKDEAEATAANVNNESTNVNAASEQQGTK